MMDPSTLHAAPGSRKKSRRIGRGHGSGRVKTGGKGTKGQKGRTGASIPAYFEGGQNSLVHRMPVKRGLHFRNHPKRDNWRPAAVNVGLLADFPAGSTVDLASLVEAGLIDKKARRLKILGDGDLPHALIVNADAFSAGARQKIEAAGGQAKTTEKPEKGETKE